MSPIPCKDGTEKRPKISRIVNAQRQILQLDIKYIDTRKHGVEKGTGGKKKQQRSAIE